MRLDVNVGCILRTEIRTEPVLVKAFPSAVVQPDVKCPVYSRK